MKHGMMTTAKFNLSIRPGPGINIGWQAYRSTTWKGTRHVEIWDEGEQSREKCHRVQKLLLNSISSVEGEGGVSIFEGQDS